ncbi:MAG: 3'-5' exonuclease [Bacteroidetes bacterium]|nr:3'-5' exonuclease [Bacteroidota bacterium]
MQLALKKPIVFFDLETTGLNIGQDRIVEISLHKVEPNGNESTKTMRLNPEMPISAESTAIHGISNEDVANSPTLKQVASDIVQFIGGSDLGGFNLLKFDVPMLVEEFLRVEQDFDLKNRRIIDVQRIFHIMEQRNLVAAYKFYCDKSLDDAHSAEADTIATYEVYKAQIERYEELENDTEFVHEFTGSPSDVLVDIAGRFVKNEQGIPVFNFGKHKGRPVEEVLERDPGYYGWMMQGDFPLYTKKKLTEIRLNMKMKA